MQQELSQIRLHGGPKQAGTLTNGLFKDIVTHSTTGSAREEGVAGGEEKKGSRQVTCYCLL